MLLLRHILSTLAGSRSYDPIRAQMKELHRRREHDRRQRSTPIRVTARRCPTRHPVPDWKSIKRWFAWPQPTDSKMTRRRSQFNPVNRVAKTSDTKGPPIEALDWTTWDEDEVKGALQEEGHGDKAITLVSACPMTASRPARRVSNRVPPPPIPPSSAKRCVSHTTVTRIDASIKPAQPNTPFTTTPRCISVQSASSDSSFQSLRFSTPGLTDSLSSSPSTSTSPVSTPHSGSPFPSPRNSTPATTLLQNPSSSPTVPKGSSPIPVYQPVFRPATPHPAQRCLPRVTLPVFHAY